MARQVTDPPVTDERRVAMTYEEWLAWPAGEHTLSEWVDGEVTIFMPPSERHQYIAGFLFVLTSWYARALNLGEVIIAPFEMRLSPRSSREPDLLFVAREHANRLTGKRLEGPADLIVEIISEGSVTRDQREKMTEYEAAGVREYWLVDARPGHEETRFFQRTATGAFAAIPPDAGGRYHAAALPGFWFRPEWLWLDPRPDPVMLLPTIAPDAWQRALATVRPS
jgi:Uma2 family endonuclease